MIYSTNKERGNAGLSLAIAYFGANGYTISLPLNDTQDYDLIVDKDDALYKVQVKFTCHLSNSGNYQVSLKSSGGTSGKIYKRVIDTNIDLLFVVCGNQTLYLIPKADITSRSTITLGKKDEKYKVII